MINNFSLGYYIHDGKYYKLIAIARHSETSEYFAVCKEIDNDEILVIPIDIWEKNYKYTGVESYNFEVN